MTLLDGDSLLDVLGFEIERVSRIHDRLSQAAAKSTTSRDPVIYRMGQSLWRAAEAKELGFEAQRASVAELRRFVRQ